MDKIKTETIETTKVTHSLYCDICGTHICDSVEYDDGYFHNPGEFEMKMYLDDWYVYKQCLCDECKKSIKEDFKTVLKRFGFDKE